MRYIVDMLQMSRHIPRFMKIGTGVKAILRFRFSNFKSVMLALRTVAIYKVRCRSGIKWHDIWANGHDDSFRHSSNITVTTEII
jgi:hypothetical protein